MSRIFPPLLLCAAAALADGLSDLVMTQKPPSAAAASGCDSVMDSNQQLYLRLDASGFVEDTGGAANNYDLSNNFVTGTTNAIISEGMRGDAAVSNFLSRADESGLSMGAEVTFCISVWFRFNANGTKQTIISKGAGYDNGGQVLGSEYIIYRWTDNHVYFLVSNGATSAEVDMGALSVNTTYHGFFWHDASANTINGRLNAGSTNSVSYSGGSQDTTQQFLVGAVGSVASPLYFMSGWIDEVSITKGRVYTTDEQNGLYNAGAACRPTGN